QGFDPADNQFKDVPGAQPVPVDRAAAPDKWNPVYRTPGDASSGLICYQDPGSGEYHPVQEKTPVTWEDKNGARWAWDGNVNNKPTLLTPGTKTVTPYQGAGTEANLTYIDQQGNIVQQPNANFQPKTQAD